MLFLLILLVIFLSFKKNFFLWLILPLSLFIDFWQLQPLGWSGLKILGFWLVGWIIFGQLIAEKKKIKV